MKTSGTIRLVLLGMLLCTIGGLVSGCFLSPSGTKAVIEVTPSSGVIPLTIDFDGGSSTGSGGISTYTWDFGTEAPAFYEASGTYTYEHAGTFTLRLTVRAEDGSTDTETVTIQVDPAVWITDENLGRVYKLDMQGNEIVSFGLPVTEPRGITVAEADGHSWLFVACFNGGNQCILRIDPVSGNVSQEYDPPAQQPRNLTFGAVEPKRIWHVDGQSRKLYALNRTNCQSYAAYGTNYFSTSPQVSNVQFLWEPLGLDWVPAPNPELAGHLWYLEGGPYPTLYKIKIIPRYDIMSGTELQIVGEGVYIPVSSVSAIDIYDGYLWVINVNAHEILQIDLDTGMPTGNKITGFPGARPAGLEIQQ